MSYNYIVCCYITNTNLAIYHDYFYAIWTELTRESLIATADVDMQEKSSDMWVHAQQVWYVHILPSSKHAARPTTGKQWLKTFKAVWRGIVWSQMKRAKGGLIKCQWMEPAAPVTPTNDRATHTGRHLPCPVGAQQCDMLIWDDWLPMQLSTTSANTSAKTDREAAVFRLWC